MHDRGVTVVLVGVVARRAGCGHAGLAAATLAAVYPNFFATERLGLSEGLVER